MGGGGKKNITIKLLDSKKSFLQSSVHTPWSSSLFKFNNTLISISPIHGPYSLFPLVPSALMIQFIILSFQLKREHNIHFASPFFIDLLVLSVNNHRQFLPQPLQPVTSFPLAKIRRLHYFHNENVILFTYFYYLHWGEKKSTLYTV